jgi:hypothetical protein
MKMRPARRTQRSHACVLAPTVLLAWLGPCAVAWTQPHVRVADGGGPIDVAALLQESQRRSPTVAGLFATLDRSDVVVYVMVSQSAPHRPASFFYVGSSRVQRFFKIVIHPEAPRADLIAILGHELQHAVEVSAAPEICDAASLATYFRRIGRRIGTSTFETDAAIYVGQQVRADLVTSRRVPLRPSAMLSRGRQ